MASQPLARPGLGGFAGSMGLPPYRDPGWSSGHMAVVVVEPFKGIQNFGGDW